MGSLGYNLAISNNEFIPSACAHQFLLSAIMVSPGLFLK